MMLKSKLDIWEENISEPEDSNKSYWNWNVERKKKGEEFQ